MIKENLHDIDDSSYEYQIDPKRVFIVTPVYREDSGKSIHDVLLSLMRKHEYNPWANTNIIRDNTWKNLVFSIGFSWFIATDMVQWS